MWAKRIGVVAALIAAASTLLVADGNDGSADQSSAIKPIVWSACTSGMEGALGLDCGFVTVPLDYAHPSSGSAKIAVSRRRHTSSEATYQGVMLMNPGGPGGSGLWLPMIADYFPDDIAAQYDWIGFDPRGVGKSSPSLSCVPSYSGARRPPYLPTTATVERAWLRRVKGYAAACGRKYSTTILNHLSTSDGVDDIESLRVALNQQTINYYGYSYGTYLGQGYATRYPDHVRRMVLDSNVGSSEVWEQSNLSQDLAFERVMQKFFTWIATYDRVFHLGKTRSAVSKQWYTTLAGVQKHRAGGKIGPAELTDIYLNAAYLQINWPELGTMWSNWVRHKSAQPLVDYYGTGGDDNEYANYVATICVDAPWNRTWARWKSETTKMHARAAFETWGNAWYNAPCAWWPVRGHSPLIVGSKTAPPILLLDHTLDGATPFAGSLEARRLFPRSVLIATVGGTDHAASPDGNPCVDNRIFSYLRDGALTPRLAGNQADVKCRPLALPVPDQIKPTPVRAGFRLGLLTSPSLNYRAAIWRRYVHR
jgi:hypothetical protein